MISRSRHLLSPRHAKCPECGSEWAERTTDLHANNVELHDRYGRLIGFEHGVMTAELAVTCAKGHRFQIGLRQVDGGWRVVSIERPPADPQSKTARLSG